MGRAASKTIRICFKENLTGVGVKQPVFTCNIRRYGLKLSPACRAPRGGPLRILIVEDNAALARGLTASLRASGFAVDHVTHGVAALDEERLVPYNLMILDVGLPDLSGFEVLGKLRQRGSRTPVLVLTARGALSDRGKGLDLGAGDYLLKTFEPAELEGGVRGPGCVCGWVVERERGRPR